MGTLVMCLGAPPLLVLSPKNASAKALGKFRAIALDAITLKWCSNCWLILLCPFTIDFSVKFEAHAPRPGFQTVDLVLLVNQIVESARLLPGLNLFIFQN